MDSDGHISDRPTTAWGPRVTLESLNALLNALTDVCDIHQKILELSKSGFRDKSHRSAIFPRFLLALFEGVLEAAACSCEGYHGSL